MGPEPEPEPEEEVDEEDDADEDVEDIDEPVAESSSVGRLEVDPPPKLRSKTPELQATTNDEPIARSGRIDFTVKKLTRLGAQIRAASFLALSITALLRAGSPRS